MNNRVFVIGDTHFGHKKIIEFEREARPFSTIEEHDAELVRRWNAVVKKHDTVWHLGDVLFGEHSFALLSHLNGVKKLVMGNHDSYPLEKYLAHFSQVHGAVSMRGCIFTHLPIHPDQFYRFKANVHGHMHSAVLDDPRYINVSAERIDLTPRLLDEVLHEADRRNGGAQERKRPASGATLPLPPAGPTGSGGWCEMCGVTHEGPHPAGVLGRDGGQSNG